MKVCGYRIIIEPENIEEKFESSLDLVKVDETKDHEKRNIQKGKVLQVGQDAYKPSDCKGPWCKEGDIVLFTRGGGREFFTEDGKELIVVNEEDILVVMEES